MSLNEARLRAFMARALYDVAAAQSAVLVLAGDRLGLYRALAQGPASVEELATRAAVDPRYTRLWLINQHAGGYVEWDADGDRYSLAPEQAAVLTDVLPRASVLGSFESAVAMGAALDALCRAFASGGGVPHEQFPDTLYAGIARSSSSRYAAHLVSNWLPALDGMVARLERGGAVADVGCGHGAALLVMARAFERSRFTGVDARLASLEAARAQAHALGVADRVEFVQGFADDFAGGPFDLVTTFDVLHEVKDPRAVARRVRASLAGSGTWFVAEPSLSARVEDNTGALARSEAAWAVTHCLPVALAAGSDGSGVGAGHERIESWLRDGGFGRVRRLEDPLSLLFEARV